MATENIKKFYDKVATDKDLTQKLAQNLPAGKSLQNVVNIAKEQGFDFTMDELQAYGEQMKSSDVSDDELDAVAGGAIADWGNCKCYFGGGGSTKGCTCACVAGGGGKADKDGYYLCCPFVGTVTKL